MVNFNFTAIVSASSNPHVAVNDHLTGPISYDPTQFGSLGLFTFTGSSKAHSGSYTDSNNSYSDSYAGGPALYTIKITYNTTYKSQIGTLMEIKFTTINGYTLDLKLFNVGNVGFTGATLPTINNINNFALQSGDVSL